MAPSRTRMRSARSSWSASARCCWPGPVGVVAMEPAIMRDSAAVFPRRPDPKRRQDSAYTGRGVPCGFRGRLDWRFLSSSLSAAPAASPGRDHHGHEDRRLRPRIAPAGDPRLERVRGHPGHDRSSTIPGAGVHTIVPASAASDDHRSGRDRRVDAARVRRPSADRARRHQRRRLHVRSQHHRRRQHRARPGHQPVQRLRDLCFTAGGNTIVGNYIGTNAAGTAALANANGVYLFAPFERQHRRRDRAGGPKPDLGQRHRHRPELARTTRSSETASEPTSPASRPSPNGTGVQDGTGGNTIGGAPDAAGLGSVRRHLQPRLRKHGPRSQPLAGGEPQRPSRATSSGPT